MNAARWSLICIGIICLAMLCGCGSGVRPHVSYSPPVLPVRFVLDQSGISAEADASIWTPVGVFSLGADLPIIRTDEVMIILRDRNAGEDQVYRVRSGRHVCVLINGSAGISIGPDGRVVIDITDGAVRTVEVSGPLPDGSCQPVQRAEKVAPPAVAPALPLANPSQPSSPANVVPAHSCVQGRLSREEDIPPPLSEVRGSVTNANGRPIAGARVRNVVPGCEAVYSPETSTDGGGGYNFAQLNPQPYRVTLLSPGDGTTSVDFVVTEFGHRYVVDFVVWCDN